VQAALVAVPLIAILSTLLGPELLLLSLAAVALMQLGLIWEKGRGTVPPGWDALIGVTLPWLAGHTTFAPVTLRSATLAVLFALAWGSAWRVTSPLARAVMIGSQLLAAIWLIVLHQPLAAGTVLLLVVPEIALLPWTPRHLPVKRYVRYTRLWLMAAMVATALVI
jgi:hypothetical protein